MPRKPAPRYNIKLSQAMRLRHLFYPFYQSSELAPDARISRDAIMQELVRSGFVRMRTRGSPVVERVLFGRKKPTSFTNIQVTRLGRAVILSNKLARSGKFEDLGKYFTVKGKDLVRKGRQRTIKVQATVGAAYIVQLMHDLTLERIRAWRKKFGHQKVPQNLSPKFSPGELIEALEREVFTRKDRRETSISRAERVKQFEQSPRYDDLNPDQRRFQIEREKIINFAVYMLRNKLYWKEIQDEFSKLWNEYQKYENLRKD